MDLYAGLDPQGDCVSYHKRGNAGIFNFDIPHNFKRFL
jgi:hypothetical protein